MKPRALTAVLLFVSSFSPLFLIVAVKDFDFKANVLLHPIPILTMLIIVAISVALLLLVFALIKKGDTVVLITKVSNRSTDIINYTIPYMLSFIGINLESPSDIISTGIFLIILLLLTITSKSVFINPILALVGYGLYDIEYMYNNVPHYTIVICRYELQAGESYYIRNLTQFLDLITGRQE